MTLKYVQIEPISTCNQRCFFCPVSLEKKEKVLLSQARLEKIIAGLKQYSIENVAISGFTEPTHDKGLVEKVRALREAGLKVTIYTNGSGLKPELTAQLLELGVAGFTINLSTLDETQYHQTRGTKDLLGVIPNLDYLVSQPSVRDKSVDVTLVVIGRLDKEHADNLRVIYAHYGEVAQVMIIPMVEFSGKSPKVLKNKPFQEQMQGCLWERHTEWMHFNADGDAILCCQDYHSKYNVGSIDNASVEELFNSEQMNQWRDWMEGRQSAPQDFMCRNCLFAKRTDQVKFLEDYYCSSCVLPQELDNEGACQRCGDVGQMIKHLRAIETTNA